MKKLVSLLLTVCMCLSVGVMLTACDEEATPTHTHTYKTEWSKDSTHHWHECEGEDCTDVSDKAEHTVTNGACSVCGYAVGSESNGESGTATPIVYTVADAEWTALFSGDTFKNVTAKFQGETYANDVLASSATTYKIFKLADNSLYFAETNATYANFVNEGYITEKEDVWYCLGKQGGTWYGMATAEDMYDVSQTPIFDYVYSNTSDFTSLIDQPTEFTYNESGKCYVRDLGVLSGVYHNTVKVYFENGALVKVEYVSEWTSDGSAFKSVQTAMLSDYGTTVLTIPSWTIWAD